MQKTERLTTSGCRQKGCPPSREAVLKIKRRSQVRFISEKRELRFRSMRRRLNVVMRSVLKKGNHSVVGTETKEGSVLS